MILNIKILSSFILCFLFAMTISPICVRVIRKIGIKQTTLIYVDNHTYKSGTPTMGGIIFLIALAVIGLIYTKEKNIGMVAIVCTLAFGFIGFIDDFIKVRLKQNKGLKAYQKIIAQLMLSVVIAFYCYNSKEIGPIINIPFFKSIYLGWGYIPFTIFVLLATTNAVNLTDRLDGLACKTSIAYFGSFLIILLMNYREHENINEISSLIMYITSFLGGLFAFLWINAYPAKIFMGDTGSLAIGSGVAIIAIFTRNPFLILIIGIMYVLTSISVVMQVLYFKLTKKRIFIMAPLHHHLEYKGIKESKIVSYYTIITIIFGVIAIYSQIVL